MAKNLRKELFLGLIVLLTLVSFITPSILGIARANEVNNVVNESVQSKQLVNTINSLNVLSTQLTPEQILMNASSLEVEGDNTIITIPDEALLAVVDASGENIPELSSARMLRGHGVTKFIIYGQTRYGNFNAFLSQTSLRVIKYSVAAFNAIKAIVQAYLGNFIGLAYSSMNAILNIIRADQIRYGKVFLVRSWWYAGSYNQ
ncbi:MAG: hypothetical protein LBV67_01685 [Streptococcaceae bacterium]|jgi:hypothetical protein|nr:hypothetical protein [Streptococcaceae bacterium]